MHAITYYLCIADVMVIYHHLVLGAMCEILDLQVKQVTCSTKNRRMNMLPTEWRLQASKHAVIVQLTTALRRASVGATDTFRGG